MASLIDLKIDTSAFDKVATRFSRAATLIPQAEINAVNEAGRLVRSMVATALVKQTGANHERVVKGMHVVPASVGNPKFRLIDRDVTTKLSEFNPVKSGDGVTASAWGASKHYHGAFLATMPNGHKGVFKRLPNKMMRSPKAYKQAIEELYGPAIPKEMIKGMARERFIAVVAGYLPALVEREIGRLLAAA